jgi:hypothetical protein
MVIEAENMKNTSFCDASQTKDRCLRQLEIALEIEKCALLPMKLAET